MEQKIIDFIESKNSNYNPKIPKESLKKIHDLLINDEFTEPETEIEYHYYGWYYAEKGDETNMIKYYLMAIDKGDSVAMYNLGLYYEKKGDEENMMKDYLMAVEKGNNCH